MESKQTPIQRKRTRDRKNRMNTTQTTFETSDGGAMAGGQEIGNGWDSSREFDSVPRPTNRIFTIDRAKVDNLTSQDIDVLINAHNSLLGFYEAMERFYSGEFDIFRKKPKPVGKPDHRIGVNLSRYIVDTSSSYFNGKPARFSSNSKDGNDGVKLINQFRHDNLEDDLDAEISKYTAIYGNCYKYIYMSDDDEPVPQVAVVKPTDCFIVYSDDVKREPLLAVIYNHIDDNSITADIFTAGSNTKKIYKSSKNNGKTTTSTLTDPENPEKIDNAFKPLPLIEFMENSERQGRIEVVATLINAYNEVLSDKVNDVSYFADAYLKLIGIDLKDSEVKSNMRDKRVLWSAVGSSTDNQIDIGFLTKPEADATQENTLGRIEKLIYKTAMVFNSDDSSFSGNVTGEALKLKLRDMNGLATSKASKFKASYLNEYKALYPDKDYWKSLEYTPTFDEPHNLESEAKVMQLVHGIVSPRTELGLFSPITNIEQELKQIKEVRDDENKELNKSYPLSDNNAGKNGMGNNGNKKQQPKDTRQSE